MPYSQLSSVNFKIIQGSLALVGVREVSRPTAVLFRQENTHPSYSDFWITMARETTANLFEYCFKPKGDPIVLSTRGTKFPISSTLQILYFENGVAIAPINPITQKDYGRMVNWFNEKVSMWEQSMNTQNYAVREVQTRSAFQPRQNSTRSQQSGGGGNGPDLAKYNDHQLQEPSDFIPHNKLWEVDMQ